MAEDRIKVASPQIGDEEIEAVARVLRGGRYVSGPEVAQFEAEFACFIGTDHAVAVNSGTAALHAAMAAAGIQPGDEVIVPALTFFSTVTAVIHQGGVPVFVDIAMDSFSIDPDDLARALNPRTKAIIPVHYFGNVADMDKIMAFANAHSLVVIEDGAQAHGSTYDGKLVGSIGDFGAFSFFATKHMTTGEGGIVTTNDAVAADYMRRFRGHGMQGRDDHIMLGYNYRMPEYAAAMGRIQLRRLDALNAKRVENSERIIAGIRDLAWLRVPNPSPKVGHTYFWCHILIDEEALGMTTVTLCDWLSDQGVEVRQRYSEPLYRQPLMTANLPAILKRIAGDHLPDYGALHLPNVERVAGSIIGLPNRPDMTVEDCDRVIAIVRRAGIAA